MATNHQPGRRLAPLASVLLLPATPAPAQPPLQEVTSLGTCESLIVAGRDRTLSCYERLISAHSGDRSAFVFRMGGASKISFTGPDGAAAGDGATISLDKVLVWRDNDRVGSGPEIVPASGTCTYPGPRLGISTITCEATTAHGRFSGRFHTDGQEAAPEPEPDPVRRSRY